MSIIFLEYVIDNLETHLFNNSWKVVAEYFELILRA